MSKLDPSKLVRENIKKLIPYKAKEISCKVKLDANESPFPIKVEEIVSPIPLELNRYPDPEAKELRKALGKRLRLSYEKIMVGNGSDELIYYLILTFGGPVLYPVPTFSMYGIISQSIGVERIESKLDNDFDINIDEFIKLIKTQKPHLIFLSSPNNPTGNTFSSEKILKVIDVAQRYSSVVVLDEAYQPFSSERGYLPLLDDFPNLLILRTLSKIGLAGLRVGFLIGREDFLYEVGKVRLPYNLDLLSQYIAKEALLRHYDKIKRNIGEIKKERDRLLREMAKIKGVKVFPSEANFILFKVKNGPRLHRRLMKEGILLRDLSGLVENSLRVTVGTKEENQAFLSALKRFI